VQQNRLETVLTAQLLHSVTWNRMIQLLSVSPSLLNFVKVSVTFRVIIAINMKSTVFWRGHAVAQLVEALRYMPEGRGFDSRWFH
jgi:hypothetical protein